MSRDVEGSYKAELIRLHDGLAIPGRMKRDDKVQQKIDRLRQEVSRVSHHDDIRVETGDGNTASAIIVTRNDSDDGAGACILRSSHTDRDAETLLRTLWTLTEIEATFRSFKSELGLRSIWYQKDDRIAAHLFLAILAFHVVHRSAPRLKAAGITLS